MLYQQGKNFGWIIKNIGIFLSYNTFLTLEI